MNSKAANKRRGSKAIGDMKAIGFHPAKTKVVLKSLLKSYAKSWELIEKDNYSVLVDAILSYEEDQGFIKKTNEVADNEDLQKKEEYVSDDTALLRKRSRSQDENEASLASEQTVAKKSKTNMPNSEGDTSQQALIKNSGTGREVAFPFERSKGKEVVDSPMLPASQNFVCFKEPKLEPGNDGNWTGNSHAQCSEAEHLAFESPILVMPQPCSSSGLQGNIAVARSHSAEVDHMISTDKKLQHARPPDEVINESKENPPEMTSGNDASVYLESSMKHIEIASSSDEEVRLSLSFGGMRSGISFLDMESILRKVEDNCLKLQNIMQPNFSLMNLMRELCETVSETIHQDFNREISRHG